MELTCERCGNEFEKTNKRGPKPRFCSDACKQANHRATKGVSAPVKKVPNKSPAPPAKGLTLRDVVNIAELDLSVKQCDVIINAFTKARLRAAKRERDSA